MRFLVYLYLVLTLEKSRSHKFSLTWPYISFPYVIRLLLLPSHHLGIRLLAAFFILLSARPGLTRPLEIRTDLGHIPRSCHRYGYRGSEGNTLLCLGDQSAEVTILQKQLKAAGYYQETLTNYFGPSTARAVKRLQEEYGLPANGIYNDVTRVILQQILGQIQVEKGRSNLSVSRMSSSSSQALTGTPSLELQSFDTSTKTGTSLPGGVALRLGSEGYEVRVLQNSLAAMSKAYRVSVTGKFDLATELAVKRFQRDQGIEIDGIYGRNTHAALTQVLNGRQIAASLTSD